MYTDQDTQPAVLVEAAEHRRVEPGLHHEDGLVILVLGVRPDQPSTQTSPPPLPRRAREPEDALLDLQEAIFFGGGVTFGGPSRGCDAQGSTARPRAPPCAKAHSTSPAAMH